MKIKLRSGRPGIAGLIVAALVFAMIFTAGMGYLLFQSQADNSSYAANLQAQRNSQLASQEQVTLCAIPASANLCVPSGSSPPGSTLTLEVNDSGGFPVSVMSWFVRNTTSTGKIITPGVVQLSSPVNLDVGNSAIFPLTGYTYSKGTVFVSVVTSRGNVFTAQYPLNTKVSSINTTNITVTSTGLGAGGGNSLVVMMAATPLQAFTGSTITDNVTLFNYSNAPMSNPVLIPSPPSSTTTGTAGLTPTGCTGPFPSGNILPYTGGLPPHISFLCTYKAVSGQVGGLASFSGSASVLQAGNTIYSAATTSNLVQIGGLTNPLAQGAFTSNFFFFKYSSCNPTPTPCTPNYTPPANVNNFPQAVTISAGSNYYVAFYLNITNTFNSPLPILGYTFVQLEASAGNESDWWIVGTNKSMTAGTYYPTYGSTPTFTSYPTDCAAVNANNVPTDNNCIYVDPGKTVTITLAACGPSAIKWDWGSSQYGAHFTGGVNGCTSSTPYLDNGGTASGSATAAIIVISFEYNGAVYTQDIAFHGVAFTS